MKLTEAIAMRSLEEATVIQKYHTEPLKDSDTIRVYHGARDPLLAYQAVTRGLSGGSRAQRVYSYESNNNPKGLFVTPDLRTAKEFGQTIIEFHTRVRDLEIPVWPGGSFTVPGQMSQMFNSDDEREQERLRQRMRWSQSEYEFVKNSDRPEVAAMLIMSGERQALFTGDLNANSVRAIWVTPNRNISSTFQGFDRVKPNEFKRMYDSGAYGYGDKLSHKTAHIPIKPQDDVSGDEFIDMFIANEKIKLNRDMVIKVLLQNPDYIDDRTWNDRQANRIKQDIRQKYG